MRCCIDGRLLLFCHYQNKMSSTTQNEATTIFDNCANDLELNGYALLPIPTMYQNNESERKRTLIAKAFATARCTLDDVSSSNTEIPIIDPSSDSGSWTGYHHAAVVNGRYNQYREGFVFSNGEMFNNVDTTNNNISSFENDMNNLFDIMHDDISNGVLRAIERRLELPDQYFDKEFGPTTTSSQWHLKRYVLDDDSGKQDHNLNNDNEKKQDNISDVVLPVHTDPSLISVVIVDQVGSNEGVMGLQVYHPSEQNNEGGTYKEISHSGHDVAVIFVGSVLNYLTKGQIFSAAKHRVVNWTTSNNDSSKDDKDRMAATLFVRPNGDSVMQTLPSPYLQSNESKKKPPTFSVWNQRVARNYMKKKQQQKG